ncbi:hypothetical protein ACHWQZ_G003580 [Mnemiopsis leidyi]
MTELSTWSPTTTNVYSIDDKAEKYVWIIYYVIVLLSSLIGDSIILAASIAPNGIRLNRFIVTIMQHIAVSDLISCFSFVLPKIASFISNEWVVEGLLGKIVYYLDSVILITNTTLIALMSTSKFLLLKYPIHVGRWTIKRGHVISALVWIYGNIFATIYQVVDNEKIFDVSDKISADNNYTEEIFWTVTYVITLIIPLIVMITTTLLILGHLNQARRVSRRSRAKTRVRGVATVVITASVYCVSILPFTEVCFGAGTAEDFSVWGGYYEHVIA